MILFIGDTHFPFAHKAAMQWAIKLANELNPEVIVQMGDLLDQFSFSHYARSHKMDPDEELKTGRSMAQRMWAAMPKKAKKFQMMGNHDDRMIKLALKCAPDLVGIVGEKIEELYTFPGVTTVEDYEFEVDGIMVQHGHRSKLGDHARYNQCSTVVGHSHRGGVVYLRNRNGTYWELDCGFLGEVNSQAFKYLAQKKVNTTQLGVGLVDSYGPRFIPYVGS